MRKKDKIRTLYIRPRDRRKREILYNTRKYSRLFMKHLALNKADEA